MAVATSCWSQVEDKSEIVEFMNENIVHVYCVV